MSDANPEKEGFTSARERLERLKLVAFVLKELQTATRHYLVAIARLETKSEGTFVGTGTIMEVGLKVLLVTAEHVISDIEKAGFQDVAFSNGDKRLYCSCALESFKRNTEIDVAFLCIPRPEEPASDRIASPERLVGRSASGVETDILFINGLPGKYSRFLKISGGLHSRTLPFAACSAAPKWPEFDPTIHFSMNYAPEHCIAEDGNPAELPDTHGLSGVAVWNTRRLELGASWTPDAARIVGIIQRWDQDGQCLIATRIEHILPFLKSE